MPDTIALLNNPIVWSIIAITVVCYSSLIAGYFSQTTTAQRLLQLQNTQILLGSLPLLGLLGTIIGLLNTFAAMSQGIGNQAELISAGIADALFTTEVGLLMVIPGWLLLYQQRQATKTAMLNNSQLQTENGN